MASVRRKQQRTQRRKRTQRQQKNSQRQNKQRQQKNSQRQNQQRRSRKTKSKKRRTNRKCTYGQMGGSPAVECISRRFLKSNKSTVEIFVKSARHKCKSANLPS